MDKLLNKLVSLLTSQCAISFVIYITCNLKVIRVAMRNQVKGNNLLESFSILKPVSLSKQCQINQLVHTSKWYRMCQCHVIA